MPETKGIKPVRSTQSPYLFVGMSAAVVDRFQGQLGLLEAAKTSTRTPQSFEKEAQSNDHIALMVYQDCLPFLQEQMATGTPPSVALAQWLEQAEVFLRCLRVHRTWVLSVALDQMMRAPQALRTRLQDKYASVFRNDAPGPVAADHSHDPAVHFLAMNTFMKSAPARRMQAELEASSTAIGAKTALKTPDIDDVFRDLHAARAQQVKQGEQIAAKERDIETTQAELTQARQDTRAARNQLQWTRKELETSMSQADTAIKDCAQLSLNTQELHGTLVERDAHIEALYRSTSWRVTRPLRFVRRLFGKG